ncbi:ComEC/Rec2 family competence protein [Arthrobacter sp. MDT3-44]
MAWAAAAIAIRGGATGAAAGGLLAAAVGLVLACLVFLVPSGSSRKRTLVAAQALAAAATMTLVLLAAAGSLARADAGPVDDAVAGGIPFTAVLRISGEPSLLGPGTFGGGNRYLLDADVIGGMLRGDPFASTTPVVVFGSEQWAGLGTGDTVRVLGIAKPPDRIGEAAAVFFPSSRPAVTKAAGWLGYTADLRTRFRDLAVRDSPDGLLPGMVLGDRAGLEPALKKAMTVTGLTHLTAVSGANCSYVVAFAFLGLRAVRLPRLPAAAGAVMALVGFVMLVRPEPSVLRAAVMGTIGVAAVLSGRGRASLTLLMLSIIILLAVDPWLSVSFAFLLSVAATLGLVTAGPRAVDTLELVMPRVAAQLLAIPLTAQLFCTPILVLIQPVLPVYSLPANVLASPVVPAITLVGMLAVLALVAAPVLAQPLIAAAQWGTRWIAGVADTLAAAPAASVPWIPGAPGAAVAALASLSFLVLMVQREAITGWWGRRIAAPLPPVPDGGTGTDPDPGPGAGPPPSGRAPRGARTSGVRKDGRRRHRGAALVLLVVLCAVGGAFMIHRAMGGPMGSWVMAMCDVGQGDGIVVRTTAGHALVVDAGPDPDAMDRCLDRLEVDVIDALVITHLHDDHYGGVEGAMRGRTLTALYYSTSEENPPREVTEAAAAAGLEAERLTSSTTLDLPQIQVDVLWPTGDTVTSEENNASAVLDVVVPTPHRSVMLLLTGDLEEDAAAALLATEPALADGGVDILKIAHHGARNGGTAVLEAIAPSLALISVGKDNDYGHPHAVIIDALARLGIATARTDELGSFTVEVVGDTVEVRQLR